MSSNNLFQNTNFEIFSGVVEDRRDPLKLGRVRVRIFGYHTDDKTVLPTDDLPWALVLQPITSAATSGVGTSPTGIVPGAWVQGYFIDNRDQQIPVVIGTLAGYQSVQYVAPDTTPVDNTAEENASAESAGGVLVDSGSSPVRTSGISSPSGWVLGQTSEKYESGGRGPGVINDYTKLNDPGGASYGAYQLASFLPKQMPNGKFRKDARNTQLTQFVQQSRFSTLFTGLTPATTEFDSMWKKVAADNNKAFMADQHDFIQKNNYQVMLSKLKMNGLDLTGFSAGVQDLIWSTAVQFGPNRLSIFLDPLKGKTQLTDVQIVNLVSQYKLDNVTKFFSSSDAKIQAGITARFKSEQQALLKLCDSKTVASSDDESTTTYGGTFKPSQDSGNKQTVAKTATGFRDPSGYYPTADYDGEQDTNKLARGISKNTASQDKSENRAFGMPLPEGSSFDQPANPYAAQYPYNKVFESESGHVVEYDDTPGRERINVYHTSGTFTEIDAYGNQVNRIVGSSYSITDCNGYIHVEGKANVSVSGSINVYVGADANIEVEGSALIKTGNDAIIESEGDVSISAGGDISMHGTNMYIEVEDEFHVMAQGNAFISPKDFNVLCTGDMKFEGASFNAIADAAVALDGSEVYLDSGKAIGASSAKYSFAGYPQDGLTYYDEVEIEDTFPPTKNEDQSLLSESPDDKVTAEEAYAQMQSSGLVSKDDLGYTPSTIDDSATSDQGWNTEGSTSSAETDYFLNMTAVPDTLKVSQNFTIADLTTKAVVTPTKLQAQYGLTVGQIAANLHLLATYVLEPIKKRYPDMIVTSCFRTYSNGSQHTLGQAVDIQFKGLSSNQDIYAIAKDLKDKIPYDQLIVEYKTFSTGKPWVHVSYKSEATNRKQLLTLFNNKTYAHDLVLVA